MPYLSIQTNLSVPKAQQQELMQQASSLLASELGKAESYVMVAMQPETTMLFAGNEAPTAYLEMKSIGLPEEATGRLSARLCSLVADTLQVDQSRIYIEFSNAQRHLWGWSGGTF